VLRVGACQARQLAQVPGNQQIWTLKLIVGLANAACASPENTPLSYVRRVTSRRCQLWQTNLSPGWTPAWHQHLPWRSLQSVIVSGCKLV